MSYLNKLFGRGQYDNPVKKSNIKYVKMGTGRVTVMRMSPGKRPKIVDNLDSMEIAKAKYEPSEKEKEKEKKK